MSRATRRCFATVLAAVVGLASTTASAQTSRTASPLRGVLWTPEPTDSLSVQLNADVRTRLTDAGAVTLVRDIDLQNTRVASHGSLATFDDVLEMCKLLRATFYVKVAAEPVPRGFAAVAVVGPSHSAPPDTLRESGASIRLAGQALAARILRKVPAFAP
jgi:hypothetical protein